jgi:integrase
MVSPDAPRKPHKRRRAGIESGHAHRFRDTFTVRLLEKGASLYVVAKLLGIAVPVAKKHYAPYVQELRARARRLILQLDFDANRIQYKVTPATTWTTGS